jgi:hypothetical protein
MAANLKDFRLQKVMRQSRRAGEGQGRLAEATVPARTTGGRLGEPSLPLVTDALLFLWRLDGRLHNMPL